MSTEEQQMLRGAAHLTWIALCGIVLVLLLPNPGQSPGKSFYEIARTSSWGVWGEWPALWCSLKLILLCAALILFLVSLGLRLMQLNRATAAWVLMGLGLAPVVGVWLGLFFLLKAVF